MKKELKYLRFSLYCISLILCISSIIALNTKDLSIVFESLFCIIPGVLFAIYLDIYDKKENK